MPPRSLLGVSFPRSGHHFLERLLRASAGPDYSYCEFYGPAGCCRQIPCSRTDRGGLRLQKNHDFGLDVPRGLDGHLYVIQSREPLGAIVSDRQMYVEAHGPASAAREDHEVWLGRRAAHYVGFHRRWVSAPPPRQAVRIDYDALRAEPAHHVARVLRAAGRPVDDAAVTHAIEPLLDVGDFRTGYRPRPLLARPHVDEELLATFESLVLDHAPDLRPGRQLPRASAAGTLVELVFRAARPGTDPTALVDEALADRPGQPLLLHWQAQLARARGDVATARAAIDRADATLPDHPVIVAELAHTAHAQGDLPVAIAATERLRTLHADPGHEVLLAVLLAATGDRDATAAQIARAREARPAEPGHWGALAGAARDIGDVDLAAATEAEARALREQR